MKRFLLPAALAWALSVFVGCTASRIAPTVTTSDDAWYDDDPASLEVMRKLEKPIDLTVAGSKMVVAVEAWRSLADVNVVVNWAALEAAGIEQDLPVSLSLRGVPAGVYLELLIDQAGAAAQLEKTDWCVEQGVVKVSTRRDLLKVNVTRVYDIRDFLVGLPFEKSPKDPSKPSGNEPPKYVPTKEPMIRPSATHDVDMTREEMIEHLTTMIQDTVGIHAEWAAYGGDVSSLRELNGLLIIKADWRKHREIEKLYAALRERQ